MSDRDQGADQGRRGWGGAHVDAEGSRTVVRLWGEHDVCTATSVGEALSQAVSSRDGDVVVDLADVSFLGASTLGLIACTDGVLRQQGRSLSLRSPSGLARRLLEVCHMASLIEGSFDQTRSAS